jgi:hypothetical protein
MAICLVQTNKNNTKGFCVSHYCTKQLLGPLFHLIAVDMRLKWPCYIMKSMALESYCTAQHFEFVTDISWRGQCQAHAIFEGSDRTEVEVQGSPLLSVTAVRGGAGIFIYLAAPSYESITTRHTLSRACLRMRDVPTVNSV